MIILKRPEFCLANGSFKFVTELLLKKMQIFKTLEIN